MVAFLGLFKQRQILVEHLLLGEGDAVNAHQLLTFLVAAPVSAGKAHHLGGFDRSCGGKVRTAAEVGEITLSVSGNGAVFQLADKLAFIRLAPIAESLQRIGFADFATHDVLFAPCQFQHLVFNAFEVLVGDFVVARVDVVVETIFNGRTDAEFHAREEFLKRFGEQMGRRMPEGVFALFILPFEKLYRGVLLHRSRQVIVIAVELDSENVLSKTRADALRYFQRGGTLIVFAAAAVGKFYVDHLSFQ